MEVHPEPEKALCDGPNMIKLSDVEKMLVTIRDLHAATREFRPSQQS
jgi:2-dehydro-3-deoxyphosphooctonate aldolase (KDO 8-P synthase)